MSKTRKRVLSVLTILFAVALVFTACFALAGCGDSETTTDPEGTGSTGTTWPTDWTVYKFGGTKNDEECVFAVYSDGWFLFGSDSQADSFAGTENGATLGYWGYMNEELVFVRINGSFYMGSVTYVLCDMTENADGSVTISNDNVSGTITDIGCLVGEGMDLSEIELAE